jgi:hypothetical protein
VHFKKCAVCQRGAFRTSRTVFVRCTYGAIYGAMYGFVYGVCTVHRATYGSTYGLKKRPTDKKFREKNGFSTKEKNVFLVECASKHTDFKSPPIVHRLVEDCAQLELLKPTLNRQPKR